MIRQCQLCEDIHLATFHCLDCDEDMCEIMKIGHSKAKVSKHHTIIPIPELKSVVTSPSKESSCNVCPIHNDSYRYYDEICQTRICRDCFALTHYGHRCVSIEEGFLEKKKLCEEMYKTDIIRHKDEFEELIGEVERKKEELDRKYSDMKDDIKQDFRKIYEVLTRREESLLSETDSLFNSCKKAITDEQGNINDIVQRLKKQTENWTRSLEEMNVMISTESMTQHNRLFSLCEGLLQERESIDDTKRKNLIQMIHNWLLETNICYLINNKNRDKIIEEIDKLGVVVEGETSPTESIAEGVGLKRYEHHLIKDAEFEVRAYYKNGMRKEIGGDTITVTIAPKDDQGRELTEEERSLQVNITDEKNGIYKIKYRSLALDLLEGRIRLHVKLNSKDIRGSPFLVKFGHRFEPPVISPGYGTEISADGFRFIQKSDGKHGWCQISPFPLDVKLSFRYTRATSAIWFKFVFWGVEEEIEDFNANSGRFCWRDPCHSGNFYQNRSLVATKPGHLNDKLSLRLTKDSLECYSNDHLKYVFKAENRAYKLIICMYYTGDCIELLSS